MSEIKTNASQEAATLEVLNQFIPAKADLSAFFDEQLPYQLLMAV